MRVEKNYMEIYKSLNNLFEQPFFKEIVEIFKFFKLQKTYWSVVFVLIIFVLGQISSLSIGEKIEKYTQSQLQSETINFIEKIFWYAFEFIFVNGSWWGLTIGIIVFCSVSLVRVYEVKFSNSITQKFEPKIEWLQEIMLLKRKGVGRRYAPNLTQYENINIKVENIETNINSLSSGIYILEQYHAMAYHTKLGKHFLDDLCDIDDFNIDFKTSQHSYESYFNEPFYLEENEIKINKFHNSKEIDDLKEIEIKLLKSISSNDSKTAEQYNNQILKDLEFLIEQASLKLTLYEANYPRDRHDTYYIDKSIISGCIDSLKDVYDFLQSNIVKLYFKKLLLITGEALIGKTHLMCDTTVNRLNANQPTVLFFGHEFSDNKSIISNMICKLGLTDCSEIEFLEALNKLGIEHNSRTLIMIDAINETGIETKRTKLWKEGIIEFCEKIKSYPNLALALSIRDVEKNKLITNDNEKYIEDEIVEIQHRGFEGIEIEAVHIFCNALGVEFPKVPLHTNRLFVNPGMLFLYIEVIKETTQKIDTSIINPTTIFKAYIDKLNRDFSQKYSIDEDDRIVEEAINLFISLGTQQDYTHFYIDQKIASKELKALHVDILTFLKNEGVLNKYTNGGATTLYFTYQKFENFFIAEYLLNDFEKNKSIIFDLIKGYNGAITEALFMQIPEKLSKDIFDLNVWLIRDKYICEQYITSLVWRKRSTISEDVWKYLNFLLPLHDLYDNYLDTVLQLSSIPNHPLNIEKLHKRLLKFSIAERDYNWSIYIHNSYRDDDGIVTRIIDWAWDKNIDFDINDESLYLYGLTLGWFLTSSNRVLRDGSTKAMINLFTDKVDVFLKVLESFEEVNDLYVSERLHAVAYGIALRSSRRSGFEALALYIYKTVFAVEYVVEHILLRDYAKLTVEHIHSIFSLAVDISKIFPPYNQHRPWEIPKIEKSEVEKYRDDCFMMYGSSLDGDFQRYTVQHVIDDFLNLKIANRPHKKLPKQRYDEFFDSLTDEQNELYQKTLLLSEEVIEILKSETEYSDERQEYRNQKIKTSGFLESLTSEQYKEYTKFIVDYSFSSYDSHTLDYQSVERYIFLEAMKLGWDKELFEDFDRSMGTGRMHDDGFERIGKKYQWIALHKVLAKLSDNYEFSNTRLRNVIENYEGVYQLSYIRDIDPTTILKSKKEEQDKWWFMLNSDFEDSKLSNVEWMQSNKKLPTVSSLVDIQKDETSYLVQHMQFSIDRDEHDGKYRNLYYHMNAFIIEKDSVNDFTGWAQNNNLYGMHTQIPESHHFSEPYLREYPYSKAYDYINIDYYQQPLWQGIEGTSFNILLTSTAYFNEGKSFDKSVNESIEIALPNKWLVEQMQLKQTLNDGEWIDSTGRVVFFDPTVNSCCLTRYNENSVLFADKKLLLEFLEKNNLTLVWMMWGEKQVRNSGGNYGKEDFLGIAELQSISYWDGSKIIDEPIKIRFEKRN